MLKTVLFVVASAGIIYLSRASLRAPRSHGFCRFFAWEAILALILLNAEYWFRDPFSLHQVISWIFLIISAFLVVHAVHLLRILGKPNAQRSDDEDIRFFGAAYQTYIKQTKRFIPFLF